MKYVNFLKLISMPAALLLIVSSFVLTGGCESRFRYTCQDPSNWNLSECQKPACTATQTCPEDLIGHQITMNKIEAAQEEEASETNVEEAPKSCSDKCTE